MYLTVSNETNYNLDGYYETYESLFKKTFEILNKKYEAMMSVTFVDKDTIHEINKNYRNIDRETDVISFAFLDDKEEIILGNVPVDLGEIYICYDVALENAKKYGNTINRELSFLFVHGLLHLLGYDHMTKEDETIMFGLQDKILGDWYERTRIN